MRVVTYLTSVYQQLENALLSGISVYGVCPKRAIKLGTIWTQ
jgi:hypothetical protein